MAKVYFSRVKEAREALAAKSLELFETYEALIKEAIAAGEFEVAQKGLQFLMEHIPKDEEGHTALDPSIDKGGGDGKGGKSGPTIQIGIAMTNPNAPKVLAPQIIDIDVEDD